MPIGLNKELFNLLDLSCMVCCIDRIKLIELALLVTEHVVVSCSYVEN